mmetsp:Transcript_1976/g.7141  ORF Transcript_1976/g.7141 Transcript_1976/m.7141 type:complete len:243 (+) Transcript_1976:1761-2489(+)
MPRKRSVHCVIDRSISCSWCWCVASVSEVRCFSSSYLRFSSRCVVWSCWRMRSRLIFSCSWSSSASRRSSNSACISSEPPPLPPPPPPASLSATYFCLMYSTIWTSSSFSCTFSKRRSFSFLTRSLPSYLSSRSAMTASKSLSRAFWWASCFASASPASASSSGAPTPAAWASSSSSSLFSRPAISASSKSSSSARSAESSSSSSTSSTEIPSSASSRFTASNSSSNCAIMIYAAHFLLCHA